MVNDVPCKGCGFVYPWNGCARDVAASRNALGGRCPACFTGRSRPDVGEGARRPRRELFGEAIARPAAGRRRGREVAR